ncbi:DUF1616 domain-containing protein [Halostella sp. JP-L12]|uniref:DUF1616 domain-containing protein n=1 Tax=Halostella TaxID=1843185 RepID=UPI000EF79742|nr:MULTISPECIES: DUF1616 domain-containing protein [Halostella]NHN49811.1 DUF1616 domain-containing protein [Halostella sp. JP-L12]
MKHETSNRPFWVQLLLSARGVPVDLSLVAGYLLLADLLLLAFPSAPTALRAAVAAPLLAFVPGYALVSALYPGRAGRDEGFRSVGERSVATNGGTARRVDLVERAALAFGMSLAVVPLVVFAITLAGFEITALSVLGGLSLFAAAGVLVAAVRRFRLSPARRFRLPVRRWTGKVHEGVFGADSAGVALVNVALALSVLVAFAALGGAIVSPADGQSSSSMTLLTENESGDLVTEGYPSEFTAGEERDMTVRVSNDEGERTTYTVVVVIQRVDADESGATVLEQQEVTRFQNTVDPGERWTEQHGVAPEMLGDDLRLQYQLYRGTPPEDPTSADAYRTTHVWISVSES